MRILQKRTFVAMIATASAVTALAVGSGQASAAEPTIKPRATKAVVDTMFAAKERAASKSVVSTEASRGALATVQARLEEFVAKNGTKFTFGAYSDPATGNVVLDTDAPGDVVDPLISARDDKFLSSVKVEVRRDTTVDIFQRRDDISPFWGGAGILASGAICSTGYPVKDAAGNRWMVTAGHCYADGTSVNTESNLNNVGVVTGRALASLGGGPIDVEFLAGKSYAAARLHRRRDQQHQPTDRCRRPGIRGLHQLLPQRTHDR